MKSFDKTQMSRNKLFVSKKKFKTLTDELTGAKKFVPGVGKYNVEDSFKKISKRTTIRKGRFG
jgi:hypothetical protein